MNVLLGYILIMDAIQAFLLYIITRNDPTIDEHCASIGVDVTVVVIVSTIFGFILVPAFLFREIKGIIDGKGKKEREK